MKQVIKETDLWKSCVVLSEQVSRLFLFLNTVPTRDELYSNQDLFEDLSSQLDIVKQQVEDARRKIEGLYE